MTAYEFYTEKDSAQEYLDYFLDDSPPFDLALRMVKYIRKYHRTPIRNSDFFVDLCCGPATSSTVIAKSFGFTNCILVDFSEDMISYINRRMTEVLRGINVRTLLADLNCDTVDVSTKSAQLVTTAASTQYLNSITNMLSEAARILQPGHLFVGDFQLHAKKTDESLMYIGPNTKTDCWIHSEQQFNTLTNDLGLTIVEKHASKFSPIPGVLSYDFDFVLRKK